MITLSQENIKLFYQKVGQNERLKEKIENVMLEEQTGYMENIVHIAKESGYAFNKLELQQFTSNVLDRSDTDGELDDSKLEEVAGGSLALAITIGIGLGGVTAVIVGGIAIGVTEMNIAKNK